jgi:hypothetical protein
LEAENDDGEVLLLSVAAWSLWLPAFSLSMISSAALNTLRALDVNFRTLFAASACQPMNTLRLAHQFKESLTLLKSPRNFFCSRTEHHIQTF